MPRDPSLAESGILTGNELVKAFRGIVWSFTMGFSGATAGQRCYLRDGTTAGAPVAVTFTVGAASGTLNKEWPKGKQFTTGIFWDRGELPPSAVVNGELTYK